MERDELIEAIINQTAEANSGKFDTWEYSPTMLHKYEFGIIIESKYNWRRLNVFIPATLKFVTTHFDTIINRKNKKFSLTDDLIKKFGIKY